MLGTLVAMLISLGLYKKSGIEVEYINAEIIFQIISLSWVIQLRDWGYKVMPSNS